MSTSETCRGQKSIHYAYILALGEQTQFETEIAVNQSLFICVSQASKLRDLHAREAICFCPRESRSWLPLA